MSDKNGDIGSAKSKKIRYAWIIASLAALAVILSPVSPFALQQPAGNSVNNEDDDLPEPPQPEDISDDDIDFCGSVSEGVEYIVAGGPAMAQEQEEAFEGSENGTELTLSDEESIASEVLVGELCNRPELVQEIVSAYDPALMLVAYGCDAASTQIGDEALQSSLEDYETLYCNAAVETIQVEADSLIETVQLFRDILSPQSEGNVTSSDSERFDEMIELAQSAKERADLGPAYEAASLLDEASSRFSALLEEQEQ
jgi:hypothetical protein